MSKQQKEDILFPVLIELYGRQLTKNISKRNGNTAEYLVIYVSFNHFNYPKNQHQYNHNATVDSHTGYPYLFIQENNDWKKLQGFGVESKLEVLSNKLASRYLSKKTP